MFQSFRRTTVLTVAVSMIVGSNGAAAQTPGDLSDLVDMRGRDAESQMEERGYDPFYLRKCLEKNEHTYGTTGYALLDDTNTQTLH